MLSHLAMRNSVNKRIIGNHRHDASFVFLYKMLGKAEKFYVIVIKIDFSFPESLFVDFYLILYPLAFVGRTNTVRRIADNHHNRRFVFYHGGLFGFLRDTFSEPKG